MPTPFSYFCEPVGPKMTNPRKWRRLGGFGGISGPGDLQEPGELDLAPVEFGGISSSMENGSPRPSQQKRVRTPVLHIEPSLPGHSRCLKTCHRFPPSLFVVVDQFVPGGIRFRINHLPGRVGVKTGQRLANALSKTGGRHVIRNKARDFTVVEGHASGFMTSQRP